jgi:hypothetical protein
MGILIRAMTFIIILTGSYYNTFGVGDIGKDKIIYTHKAHTEKYNVGNCDTCHRNITKSKRAALDHYSFQEGCSGTGCHNVQDKDSCFLCHTNVKGRTPPKPVREVEFSHQGHYEQKIKCRVCHAEVDTQRIFDRTRVPNMMICLNCHDEKHKTISCKACHTNINLANSHIMDWKEEHGRQARDNPQKCRICHASSHCDRCHFGHNKEKIHPANYEYVHGSDVLGNGGTCLVCHSKTSFCDRCHEVKWGRIKGNHKLYIQGSKSCEDCHKN